jgi:hypothetical protein
MLFNSHLTVHFICADNPNSSEYVLPSLAAGGMVEFRRSLAASFLFKALLFVAQQLEAEVPAYTSPFPDNYRSGERARLGIDGRPSAHVCC